MIDKEMNNIQVRFDVIDGGFQPSNVYQFVKCYMIFDIIWNISAARQG